MKIRLFSLLTAIMLLVCIFTGCASTPSAETEQVTTTEATTQTEPVTQTEPAAVLPDLETLYNQGMEVLAQMGDNAPILFPESNIDYLNMFYPGLADIELKQLSAGVAPVTNAPFEIILVEVANEADVQTVLEIFHARADKESRDTTYPENAAAWTNNCKITSRGCYVFLAVLMDPCEIPAEFILD